LRKYDSFSDTDWAILIGDLVSGEAPKEPVISTKSGNVFEKRLIEAYITENGKDPITGEDLTLNDLLEVKCELSLLLIILHSLY
jgi:hypothetical protein